ncbi:DUF3079 domain-containing protein (plasmid) [Azotobacter chroococcum]|uniref:DUF3079 domain-containing protein n=1 Tax=Azotobacter chroococcum TaxID=353 RepID=A0AAP9YI50_9GAMM|nr:DUF3079 domain-containing protein [Azotobacter chroococcum]
MSIGTWVFPSSPRSCWACSKYCSARRLARSTISR